MEMIDTELEPVTDKFQIYMMRYYGIQRIIKQAYFFSYGSPACRMVWLNGTGNQDSLSCQYVYGLNCLLGRKKPIQYLFTEQAN